MKTADGLDGPRAFLDVLNTLDDDTREAIMERAAIMQYDGGISREDAERAAIRSDRPYTPADLLPRFPLIAMTDDGRPLSAWSKAENFLRSRDDLAAFMNRHGTIYRFGFIPGEAGFIVLDIDRGHANGADGVASLRALFSGRPIPPRFADLDQGSFPAYTRTPSGGFHLYFRYAGTKRYGPQAIAPGVEVIHVRKLLTAPGSLRKKGRYVFAGAFDQAPPFPAILEDRLIPDAETRPKTTPRPIFPGNERARPSLDRIAEWTVQDGKCSGRNDLCFGIARRAAKRGYGVDDVRAFLGSFGPVEGLPAREIETAVASAFKGAKS